MKNQDFVFPDSISPRYLQKIQKHQVANVLSFLPTFLHKNRMSVKNIISFPIYS